jgi:hypothetical protein
MKGVEIVKEEFALRILGFILGQAGDNPAVQKVVYEAGKDVAQKIPGDVLEPEIKEGAEIFLAGLLGEEL